MRPPPEDGRPGMHRRGGRGGAGGAWAIDVGGEGREEAGARLGGGCQVAGPSSSAGENTGQVGGGAGF